MPKCIATSCTNPAGAKFGDSGPAGGAGDDCELLMSAYILAGLAMMLNIRLAYSSAPYALIRFKLPENLFGVFVRTIAGALELWCLPSMTLGNIMDFVRKRMPFGSPEKKTMDSIVCYSSIVCMWSDFITYVILLYVYLSGGDQGSLTAYYWVISVSGFIFGINMVLLYAMEFQYFPYYLAGENSFPAVTSIIHYLATLMFGNRRKYDSDFLIVHIDIWVAILISFTTAVLWTCCYYSEGKDEFPSDPNQRVCKKLTVAVTPAGTATEITYSISTNYADSHADYPNCGHKKSAEYYLHLVPPSLMVLVGMGLIYTIYPAIAPGMTVPFYLIDKVDIVIQVLTAFPPVIIKILPLINPTLNPFVNMGTWGHYHRKSCKNASKADGGDLDTKGECQGCGSDCEVESLKLQDTLNPGGAGNPVTLNRGGQFTADATITITTKSEDVDLSKLSGQVEITGIKGTINKDGTALQTTSPLNTGEVLALDATGTLSGGGARGTVDLKGTIVVTNKAPQTLGSSLDFGGGPGDGSVTGSLNLQSGTGNITTGTLTINSTALTTLKTVTGSLGIGKSSPSDTDVTYSLVTPETIILGLSTLSSITTGAAGAKVTLKLPPTSQIKIAPQGGTDGISATLSEVTFSKTDANFTSLKGVGLELTLNQPFNGAQITKAAAGALTITDDLTEDTELKLEGTSSTSGTTINANIKVTKGGKLNSSATTYTLSGGITGTLKSLSNASGNVTGNLTITKVSYDPNEFHDKHKTTLCCYYGGKVFKWERNPLVWCWNAFDIFIPLQIILEIIFLYSLHHRDSSIARSIINQPKMSTFLTIVYYMCHEFMLALGFSGIGSDDNILLPMQLIGAFLMVLPAFYSKGYVIEYKRHDPNHWPTEGMTPWNAFCYWLKMSSKNTNKLLLDVFTTDLQVFFSFTHLYTPLHIYIK